MRAKIATNLPHHSHLQQFSLAPRREECLVGGAGGKRLTPPSGRRQTITASRAPGAPNGHDDRRHASIANSESHMRSSKTRSRGSKNRNMRPTGGNIINRVFDSSGPEGKVRGTPQQIIEKYLQLHRDAQLSGDRVNAENFAQHAEHYTRMLAEATREVDRAREEQEEQNRQRQAERDRARTPREPQDEGHALATDSPAGEDDAAGTLVDLPEGKPAFLDARPRDTRRPRAPRRERGEEGAPAPEAGDSTAAIPESGSDAKPARAPRAPRTRKPRAEPGSEPGSESDGGGGSDAPVILPDIAS